MAAVKPAIVLEDGQKSGMPPQNVAAVRSFLAVKRQEKYGDIMGRVQKLLSTLGSDVLLKPPAKPPQGWKVFYASTWDLARAEAAEAKQKKEDMSRAGRRDRYIEWGGSCRKVIEEAKLHRELKAAEELVIATIPDIEPTGLRVLARNDAMQMAQLLIAQNLDFPGKEEYTRLMLRHIEIWQKGFACWGEVDGTFFIFAERKPAAPKLPKECARLKKQTQEQLVEFLRRAQYASYLKPNTSVPREQGWIVCNNQSSWFSALEEAKRAVNQNTTGYVGECSDVVKQMRVVTKSALKEAGLLPAAGAVEKLVRRIVKDTFTERTRSIWREFVDSETKDDYRHWIAEETADVAVLVSEFILLAERDFSSKVAYSRFASRCWEALERGYSLHAATQDKICVFYKGRAPE